MQFLLVPLIGLLVGWAAWLGADPDQPSGTWLLPGLAILVAVLVVRQICITGGVRGAWDWNWGVPLAGLVALIAIQALNASHEFLPGSRALVPRSHFRWLPGSVDGRSTAESLRWIGGCAAMFWLGRKALPRPGGRRGLVMLLAATGAAMAVWVILQRRVAPAGALYPLTGTFVNSSHYAAYANILLALSLAYALDGWHCIRNAAGRGLVAGGFLAASLILLYSIFRSGSRMGVMISLIILGGVGVIAGVRAGGWRRRILPVIMLAAILIPAAWRGVCDWKGCEGGWSFRQVQDNAVDRLRVQKAVLAMVPDRWLSGYGAGTFEKVFPYYQPQTLRGSYRHAHNEYVEGLVEFGLVGMLLIGWLVWAACFAPAGAGGESGVGDWQRIGCLLALGALALHALSDFPFRVPVTGFLAALLAGMSGGHLRKMFVKEECCE